MAYHEYPLEAYSYEPCFTIVPSKIMGQPNHSHSQQDSQPTAYSRTNNSAPGSSTAQLYQAPGPYRVLPAPTEALSEILPGQLYSAPTIGLPTAQAILNRSYEGAGIEPSWETLAIVPRSPERTGKPSLPMIVFSVRGRPGISVQALRVLEPRGNSVVGPLDGADDLVWSDRLWRKTSLTIEWPGISTTGEHMPCLTPAGAHCTRLEVAQLVGYHLREFFKGKAFKWGPQARTKSVWDLKKLHWRDVRVLGISYYRKTWVPVLAVDATGLEHEFE